MNRLSDPSDAAALAILRCGGEHARGKRGNSMLGHRLGLRAVGGLRGA